MYPLPLSYLLNLHFLPFLSCCLLLSSSSYLVNNLSSASPLQKISQMFRQSHNPPTPSQTVQSHRTLHMIFSPSNLQTSLFSRSLAFSSLLFSPLLCFHLVHSLSRSPGLPAPGLRHPCSPSWVPVRDSNLVNHVRRFPNLQPVSPTRSLGDGNEPAPSLVNQARWVAEAGADPEPILRSATACPSTMPCHALLYVRC